MKFRETEEIAKSLENTQEIMVAQDTGYKRVSVDYQNAKENCPLTKDLEISQQVEVAKNKGEHCLQIGIFGGSFNPIHNGHIHVIKSAKELCGLDKVYVVPAYISPLKNTKEYVSAEHRLNMCKLATENLPFAEVSDIEIKRQGVSYTIDTLEYFEKINTNAELYLIIGSDNFLNLHKWFRYEDILKICNLIVIPRSISDIPIIEKKCKNDRIIVLNTEVLDISSTLIRMSTKYHCFLPLKVVEYCVVNKLFGES
ncbi:hypothetical protein FACS1894132_04010 [Clostridia bacterium]|nr:hypothetical protein FACS1894132_04010 [Clostridia bacterium]